MQWPDRSWSRRWRPRYKCFTPPLPTPFLIFEKKSKVFKVCRPVLQTTPSSFLHPFLPIRQNSTQREKQAGLAWILSFIRRERDNLIPSSPKHRPRHLLSSSLDWACPSLPPKGRIIPPDFRLTGLVNLSHIGETGSFLSLSRP